MTRAQFLNDLYRRLGGLSKEQAEQHLTYYAEMLADRVEEGMSEEEAVASMEDVDTIAQRILQDEGVPAGGFQPPRAPDLPRTEPVTGGYAADSRPKRDWRGPAKILLWALAVLVAGGVVFSRLTSRHSGMAAEPVDTAGVVDRGTYETSISIPEAPEASETPDGLDIGGVHIGPDGIYVDDGEHQVSVSPGGVQVDDGEHQVSVGPGGVQVDGEEYVFWGEWSDWAAEEGYSYAGEVYSLDASGIQKIEIDWIAGMVDIQPGDSGTIQFCEDATRELTDNTRLVYEIKGKTLHISFWKTRQNSTSNISKLLTVRVPESLLNELEAESISGDLFVSNITVQSMDLSTTSGEVILTNVAARELDVSTTSGSIDGNVEVRELDVETISGDVSLYLEGAVSKIDVEAISGETALTLADCDGFTLEFETVSGSLYADDFQTSSLNSKGKYTSGSGSTKIDVSSVSGDLVLLAG